MLTNLSRMSKEARKIPTLQGWCMNDGGFEVGDNVAMPDGDYTMSEATYHKWWNHFRGSGFDKERDTHFNPKNYSETGESSAEFMAACDAWTTSGYMCPVHQQLKHTEGAEWYAYQFEQWAPYNAPDLVTHSCELGFLFDPSSTENPVLSKKVQKWWTNFAKYHDPNGEDVSDDEKEWPAVDPEDPRVFRISDESYADKWPK